MIEINLLPPALRRKETPRISLPSIPIKKSLFGAAGVFLLFQVIVTLLAFYTRFELFSLYEKTESARQNGREVTKQKGETVGMEARMKEALTVTERDFYWASLLSELSNSMTKGIWLRSLSVDQVTVHSVKSEKDPKIAKNEKEEKSPKKEKKEQGQKGKKSGKDAKAVKEEKSKKAERSSKRPDRQKYLVLEGTAIGAGQETAFIGKFLKELKDNKFFSENFQEMKPLNINQKRIGQYEVYEFIIRCQFKRGKRG